MPYKVIVDHPSIGDGTELYIHGLGTFKNGTTTEIDDNQVDVYRAAHAVVDILEVPQEDGEPLRVHKPRLGAHPVDQEIFGVRVVPVGGE